MSLEYVDWSLTSRMMGLELIQTFRHLDFFARFHAADRIPGVLLTSVEMSGGMDNPILPTGRIHFVIEPGSKQKQNVIRDLIHRFPALKVSSARKKLKLKRCNNHKTLCVESNFIAKRSMKADIVSCVRGREQHKVRYQRCIAKKGRSNCSAAGSSGWSSSSSKTVAAIKRSPASTFDLTKTPLTHCWGAGAAD